MFEASKSRYLVPFDGRFRLADASTVPPDTVPSNKKLKKKRLALVQETSEWQNRLYADDRYALLLVFQAMDAAGKDSTIRAVMSGINPSGCQVHAFKQPSSVELDHDFLWRTTRCLPERGRIGIFNRSHYEEVLAVRVHPEYLKYQRLPDQCRDVDQFWRKRYRSIRSHEKHLARNGTVVIKFWLNVSKEEQKRRFLSRLNEPEKHWKFSAKDVSERAFWDRYMSAYEQALVETSRSWAPWYAIPADNKPYMRWCVAKIVAKTLRSLNPGYPTLSADEYEQFDEMRKLLM